MHSLRFRLPLFLTLYSAVVGLVLFTVANEIQEAAFERDFERAALVRATEIQSRTERAAERSELETAQREFGELAVFEEIRGAVFIAPDDKVVLGSRRNWIGRQLDLTTLGLSAAENPRVEETMRSVRNNGRTEGLFSLDRNFLTFVLPATVPVGPGELGASRGALILLVHDLSLSKAVEPPAVTASIRRWQHRGLPGCRRSRHQSPCAGHATDRASARCHGAVRRRSPARDR